MEFLEWWFNQHWILSTVFTPFPTYLWATYNELHLRAIGTGLVVVTPYILKWYMVKK